MLETAGGSALFNDNSVTAASKEAKEELNITVENDKMIFLSKSFHQSENNYIADVWLIEKNIDISEITLQKEEVEDAFWLTRNEIIELIKNKEFFNWHLFDKLFENDVL